MSDFLWRVNETRDRAVLLIRGQEVGHVEMYQHKSGAVEWFAFYRGAALNNRPLFQQACIAVQDEALRQ